MSAEVTVIGAGGHASVQQSTEVYLRADPTEKLEALSAMVLPVLKPGLFLHSISFWQS
jgi:hypothetical protein